MNKFQEHCVDKNISIYKAFKILKKTGDKCLLVTKNRYLLGTLTDGDFQTALLNGYNIKSSITKIYNKNPKFISFPKK